MRAVRSIILSVILLASLVAAERACAQYYSWGADPARFRWMRAETEGADVIYPDHTPEIGLSTLRFVEIMQPYISYGYRLPALDIPCVVRPGSSSWWRTNTVTPCSTTTSTWDS